MKIIIHTLSNRWLVLDLYSMRSMLLRSTDCDRSLGRRRVEQSSFAIGSYVSPWTFSRLPAFALGIPERVGFSKCLF